MAVTNNIKKYRKELNIRQADLAAFIGCDIHTISRYETGNRQPSLEIGLRISQYLQIPMEKLYSIKQDNM